MSGISKLIGRVSVSGIALTMAGQAIAQSDGPVLEDIIVTADRQDSFSADLVQAGSFRGARQLDTPLTVSVVTRELLNTQQAQGLLDALKNTAGVTSSQTAPTVYNNLAIRGINVENRGNYRLNGSLPIINLIDLPLEDKDRVEALKGASALYYGFTTPSGIINLTMKRPTAQPLFSTTLQGNSHGAYLGHVDVGGTSGIFGYRVNGVYGKVDSGIDHTRGTRSLIAGAFDLKPTDSVTITVDAEHIFKKLNEPGVYRFIRLPTPTAANPYPAIALPRLLKPSTNFGPDWAFNRAEETNLLGAVNWKISSAWAFTASAGISRLRRDRHFNTIDPNNPNTAVSAGPIGEYPLNISYQPNYNARNRNLRAELAGTFRTGPFVHEILIGASQNFRRQNQSRSIAQNCLYDTATGALVRATFDATAPAGLTRSACKQSFLNPHDIPQLGEPLPDYTSTTINDIGYYLFDRVKLTDWLQVLGGIRKSDYTEKNLTTGRTTFKSKPTSLSYGAVVKPVEWASVYGTYIEGLEATPTAPLTAVNQGEQLPATESKQYEAGIKVEPKRGVLLQAAFFNINRASTFVNGLNVYVQDGRARYRGVEMSATGELTRELSIYASALFLNAKQTSGAPTTTTPAFSPTLVGRRIENTPKLTLSLAASYRLDALIEGLTVNGGVFHTGRRAINPLNQAFIPGYTLFDAGVGYSTEIASHRVTFRVNAENLTGKRYWASTGGLLLAQGAPSTVKFAITANY